MKHTENIIEELKSISETVAAIPKVNIYTVPEGYFEQFADECLSWIQAAPSFGTIVSPQQIPVGYFDNLAENILSKIKSESADPVLSFGKIDHPFSVPEGYFESLPVIISSQVKPAKVISMQRSFFRYAVAAVITGALGLTLFMQIDKKENTPDQSALYASVQTVSDDNFDKALQNVNDQEIIAYLSDHGQDVKSALVASVVEENNLPAKDDYLIDENTLKNFLEEKNIGSFNN